jgi:pyruvate, water dikinase
VTCPDNTLIAFFGELNRNDVTIAGGKGASLSDMVLAGLPVPLGFVVCTETFRKFLSETGLDQEIIKALEVLNVHDTATLEAVSMEITKKIERMEIPERLVKTIMESYQRLCTEHNELSVVAVRSSAAAEDSAEASFAGQQETYLNIFGGEHIVSQVRACWGSFFKPQAIFYRKLKGSLVDTNIAVVVQRMVNPEKSGVMFTVDPVQKRKDRLMIEATWGLGEAVVSGMVTPDNYKIKKSDASIIKKCISHKPIMIIREDNGVGVRQVKLSEEIANAQVLSNAEISLLAKLGEKIEAHFGTPQDVEWAIENGNLFILQSRPVTTL